MQIMCISSPITTAKHIHTSRTPVGGLCAVESVLLRNWIWAQVLEKSLSCLGHEYYPVNKQDSPAAKHLSLSSQWSSSHSYGVRKRGDSGTIQSWVQVLLLPLTNGTHYPTSLSLGFLMGLNNNNILGISSSIECNHQANETLSACWRKD